MKDDVFRPKLKSSDANHVKHHVIRKDEFHDGLEINRILLKQYTLYPYITHSGIVVSGYIREIEIKLFDNECYSVPSGIMDLCKQYYFDRNQGIFQLGCNIHSILKQLKQKSMSKKVVKVLIRKYLSVKNKRKIMMYFNELIRLKCIEPIPKANNKA